MGAPTEQVARFEYERGKQLMRQLRDRLAFQVDRFLEARGPLDEGTTMRLMNHFGSPDLRNPREWVKVAELTKLVLMAGVIGMDITDLTPALQPV